MPLALSFSLTVHRVHRFDLLFKCARCAAFTLLLTIYFTDTYGGVCLKGKCNCFAFLMFIERLGHCLPTCFTFTLLQCFNSIKASGSLITLWVSTAQTPKEALKAQTRYATAPCRILNRLLVLLFVKHHGFESLLDKRGPQKAVEASENLQSPFVSRQ